MIEPGKKYRFNTNGTDSVWKAWDGRTCTVLRALTEKEADIDDVGPMWRVRFDDEKHTETDAFDDELYGPYKEKIVLFSESMVFTLTTDLPYGDPTDMGDRQSRYFDIATVMGRKGFVKAALIEDKAGLTEEEWGYRLHILNDIDNTPGFFLQTEHMDEEELEKLLDDLAYDLAHGRV